MQMATANEQDPRTAQHVVVLIHGLWGNPKHLKHLYDSLATAYKDEGLYIFLPASNKDNFTYDGIEVGAERITNEVEAKLEELHAAGANISKISIAGYSLGGLLARYVVGLLYKAGVFETIRPVNFSTFATPHLGVRTPRTGYRAEIWNTLGAKTLSTSGQQMFLVDDFRETGRPLLAVLADPASIFVRGLSMFKHRSIYANTLNDRSVPFYTSCISRVDPYVDPDAINIHPLPGQSQPVVLDPEQPVSPRKEKIQPEALAWHERYIMTSRTRESLPFFTVLFTLLPIAIPIFMINAGYQTYRSAQRVRLHEAGRLVDLKRYRIPLLEETQAVQDRVVETLAFSSSSNEGYLPTPPPERASSPASSDVKRNPSPPSPWPTLALTKDQFEMIDNLDAHVCFTKYPVHITKVRHTHAAIVRRMAKESFSEGLEVSGHWIKNFEV